MADSPFDEAMPLDGTVNRLDALEETPPSARPQSVLQVFVSGDSVSGSRATGLAKDLERTIQEFDVRLATAGAKKTRASERKPRLDADEEIEIALHGLALEPDAEAELQRRIRARVEEHLAADDPEP